MLKLRELFARLVQYGKPSEHSEMQRMYETCIPSSAFSTKSVSHKGNSDLQKIGTERHSLPEFGEVVAVVGQRCS